MNKRKALKPRRRHNYPPWPPDPEQRTLGDRRQEKQASRDQDQADLESGAKTPEQLRRENGKFAFKNVRIRYDLAKRLS